MCAQVKILGMDENKLGKLEQLNQQRLEVASELIEATEQCDRLQAQLNDAEAKYKSLYDRAIKAGWTTKELLSAGIKKPVARRSTPVRRRRKQNTDNSQHDTHNPSHNDGQ